MAPLESSEPRRPPRLSSMTIPDLTDKIVRPHDWQYCEAGGFGDVFRCQYTTNENVQEEVAVKAFRFSFSVDDSGHKRDGGRAARMIRRELGIWSRLTHRNIVQFLGIAYGFGRQGSASLVSMWMPHGTLHTFLEMHDDRLAVAHRLQLLLDVANGLHYLHSFPMIHGDLSGNNVLLDRNYNACLTDFGCASLVGELPEGFAYLKMSTVRPGTLRWAAPEHFSLDEGETKHTTKSDIYSFGNMALLVLSGKYPWSEVRADAAVMLRLSQGIKPGRPLERAIDDQHWALIERCWSSMSERPLAEDVVSSLQQLMGAYPPLPVLRDFLDNPTPSCSVPNHPCNDDLEDGVTPIYSQLQGIARGPGEDVRIDRPLFKNACDHAENTSHDRTIAGPYNDSSDGSRSEDTVSTPRKSVTDAPSGGLQSITKWVRGELLGKGTYGRVYLALDTSNGEMFAVKQVEKGKKEAAHLNFVPELKVEREILGELHHPHIVAYLGSEETATSLSIFLEYVPGGTIASCLRGYSKFSEEVIKSFTTQILDGLAYLHANRIIHRNIEANNILVDASGICKLSGFGNAQRINDDRGTPIRGTVFWTAPEVTRRRDGKPYGPKVDVWSAGCVVLKMWTGGRAWRDSDVFALMVKAMNRGTSLPLPSDVILSDLAVDFRNRCFVVDPVGRASATELLQHPYLTLDPEWVFTGFK